MEEINQAMDDALNALGTVVGHLDALRVAARKASVQIEISQAYMLASESDEEAAPVRIKDRITFDSDTLDPQNVLAAISAAETAMERLQGLISQSPE